MNNIPNVIPTLVGSILDNGFEYRWYTHMDSITFVKITSGRGSCFKDSELKKLRGVRVLRILLPSNSNDIKILATYGRRYSLSLFNQIVEVVNKYATKELIK